MLWKNTREGKHESSLLYIRAQKTIFNTIFVFVTVFRDGCMSICHLNVLFAKFPLPTEHRGHSLVVKDYYLF